MLDIFKIRSVAQTSSEGIFLLHTLGVSKQTTQSFIPTVLHGLVWAIGPLVGRWVLISLVSRVTLGSLLEQDISRPLPVTLQILDVTFELKTIFSKAFC